MKKFVTFILISLIVTITFAGCGKPDKKDYLGVWKCVAIIPQDQSYPDDFDSAVREAKKVEADVEKTILMSLVSSLTIYHLMMIRKVFSFY